MKKKILLGLAAPTMIMAIMAFILVLMTFTVNVSAIDISYSDSYLPKEDYKINGATSGDIESINILIDDKETMEGNELIKSKYPKVEIAENKFLGIFDGEPIIDLEILDHTEYCTVDCYSILEVTVHQSTKLVDAMETRSYVGSSLQYTNNVQTKVYLLQNVSYIIEEDQYEMKCTTITPKNLSIGIQSCLPYKTSTKNTLGYKQEFIEYNNQELSPGTYVVKVTGKKKFNEVVDWVPTIQSQRIEALAWWNITEPYGNGSMGDVVFTTTTKTYGNMVLNVDYTIAGNTLYLMTDKVYTFNNLYLGSGTTLSTQNATGAAMYIMAKNKMEIYGTVTLSSRLQPGSLNASSFSYLGDSFTTPSVANGGAGYNGAAQSGGFGGGGNGGAITVGSCAQPFPTIYQGGTGGYPFGPTGGGASSTSAVPPAAACQIFPGYNASRSGGGGGSAATYNLLLFGNTCTITATGGAGGSNYNANGNGGTTNGVWVGAPYPTSGCTSIAAGGGGGGAGGIAGIPGLNLVLRGQNITITGGIPQISLSGTSGGNGGGGAGYVSGGWQGGNGPAWVSLGTGDSGTGGGGGGGASAGSLKIYYRYLQNTTALSNVVVQTAGTGGTGGTFASGGSAAASGGSGSAGNITLYEEGFTQTTLLNPANNSVAVTPTVVNFSASITPSLVTLLNATFYLWSNGVINNTQYTTLSGTSSVIASWTRTAAQMPDASYSWGVQTCWTDGTVPKCDFTQNNSFSTFSVVFSNSSYNHTTYEMLSETYSVNVNSTGFINLSGILVWNGVEFPATTVGNTTVATFTRSIWIPTSPGQKSFYWRISSGGQLKESSPENVTIVTSQFGFCNATNTIPYYQITYRDETTNAFINATIVNSLWDYNVTNSQYGKQILYNSPFINGTQETASNHTFCFSPSFASIVIPNANYQYGNPTLGYSTKQWQFRNLPLTNTTTATTLYLINLIDSGTTPVTFQTINSQTSTVLSNVRVQTFRQISGQSTLVNDGYSDAAGTIAYFMSPITSYTIIASNPFCTTLTSTITPTSNQYNLLLNCVTNTSATFSTPVDGITYQRTPADGINKPGTIVYGYYVISNKSNLARIKFSLIDATSKVELASNSSLTNTASCNPSVCLLTITYTTYTGDNIKGRYYVSVNGTSDSDLVLIEGDAYWRFIQINQNNSLNSVGRFMLNLQEFFDSWGTNAPGAPNCFLYNLTTTPTCSQVVGCKWANSTIWAPSSSELYQQPFNMCVLADNYNKIEFNRIVTIFFFFAVFLFILGRTTGYELNHPGAFVIGMSIVIWALSFYQMFSFQGLTRYQYFNQYIFALSTSCIALGYTISIVRRYSG